MADSALRQLLILKKLPRYPKKISTKELQNYLENIEFDVSIKTVQRDLSALSCYFPIITTKPEGRGKEGVGWAFAPDSPNQGLPSMEPIPALILLMGYRHLQQLMPKQALAHIDPYIKEAEQTLETFHDISLSTWEKKVRVVPTNLLEPPTINDCDSDNIYTALLKGLCFRATYNEKEDMIVSPYGLVQRGNTTYLVVRFFDYEQYRVTAVHRFSEVEVLEESIRTDKNFNIDDYLKKGALKWQWDDTKNINLELHASEWLTSILKETPLARNQLIEPDESEEWFYISCKVINTFELKAWLLSVGDDVEVLKPAALRRWMKSTLENTLSYYEDDELEV